MTDVADIAGRLTKAQRDFLLSRPTYPWWTVLPSSERREYPGLVARWGYETNHLTTLGKRVKAHIQGNSHD